MNDKRSVCTLHASTCTTSPFSPTGTRSFMQQDEWEEEASSLFRFLLNNRKYRMFWTLHVASVEKLLHADRKPYVQDTLQKHHSCQQRGVKNRLPPTVSLSEWYSTAPVWTINSSLDSWSEKWSQCGSSDGHQGGDSNGCKKKSDCIWVYEKMTLLLLMSLCSQSLVSNLLQSNMMCIW